MSLNENDFLLIGRAGHLLGKFSRGFRVIAEEIGSEGFRE